MNYQPKSHVFPRVRVVGLLALVSSILTMVAIVSNPKVAAVGDNPDAVALSLELFASGLKSPVIITNDGTGDGRLFVNERAGVIKIVQTDGTIVPEPFLDISDRAYSEGEGGLLGLAFHPDYTANRYFYVNYTNFTTPTLQTRISRFKIIDDPNLADRESEDILLTISQPADRHNAGDIHFGPDGYLYIPLGDGGAGGDKDNNAQNMRLLLGKVVRIDVDSRDGNEPADCFGDGSGHYRVPIENPLRDGPGNTCDEIWASGLRNPWRSSFDRETGDFYIGDVGEGTREEINFQKEGSAGGENYGWSCYEGNEVFNPGVCDPQERYTIPIFEYGTHVDGCSVTGGYVYRGSKYPAMKGRYFLADYCSGNFWDLLQAGDSWLVNKHTNLSAFGYVSFGEDINGELYVGNISSGKIFLLEGQISDIELAGYLPIILK